MVFVGILGERRCGSAPRPGAGRIAQSQPPQSDAIGPPFDSGRRRFFCSLQSRRFAVRTSIQILQEAAEAAEVFSHFLFHFHPYLPFVSFGVFRGLNSALRCPPLVLPNNQ